MAKKASLGDAKLALIIIKLIMRIGVLILHRIGFKAKIWCFYLVKM